MSKQLSAEILHKHILQYFIDGHTPDPEDRADTFMNWVDRIKYITNAMQDYSDAQLTEAQERIKELESYLERIANGPYPMNNQQAASWVDTARQLANEALTPNNKNKEDE